MRTLIRTLAAAGLAVSGIAAAGLLDIPIQVVPPASAQADQGTVVVELFTSQSCYSCPPAEDLLGRLADQPGIVALEWHVDYWNDLVYGSAGRWHDEFSDPAYTERQRRYNLALRGTGSVYTPQMVFDGISETVGSREGSVAAALESIARYGDLATVNVAEASNILQIGVGGIAPIDDTGSNAPADVWLVEYISQEVTEVTGGENHGKTLVNHNIVRDVRHLGTWSGGDVAFSSEAPIGGRNCAILVQLPDQGPILGAGLCGG